MDSIRNELLILYQANLYHIVLLSIYSSMHDSTNTAVQEDSAYSAAFISFGMFGILTEWIQDGCKKTPEELAELTLKNIV